MIINRYVTLWLFKDIFYKATRFLVPLSLKRGAMYTFLYICSTNILFPTIIHYNCKILILFNLMFKKTCGAVNKLQQSINENVIICS